MYPFYVFLLCIFAGHCLRFFLFIQIWWSVATSATDRLTGMYKHPNKVKYECEKNKKKIMKTSKTFLWFWQLISWVMVLLTRMRTITICLMLKNSFLNQNRTHKKTTTSLNIEDQMTKAKHVFSTQNGKQKKNQTIQQSGSNCKGSANAKDKQKRNSYFLFKIVKWW